MKVEFSIIYNVDAGLLANADEFRTMYLNNLPVKGFDGYVIQNLVIENWIKNNLKYTEDIMDIAISPIKCWDKVDFDASISKQYNYVPLFKNILEFVEISGRLNESNVMSIPSNVVALNVQDRVNRNLYFIYPNFYTFLYTITTFYLYAYASYVPYFWNVKYLAGFKVLPMDLVDFVLKKSLIDAYTHLSNILLKPGFAGSSKSIDGVSESLTTTRSASTTLFGAAKKELQEEIKERELALKPIYKGVAIMRI